MAKKIRASILGQDINLLKNVAKRVVQNRPADVKYFTEVKEFLMDTINDKPDIVAISVNYPHKNAKKLPKVFKMALNVPVIVFGENQETKTRKDLSVSSADYKIPGVLTAHNFWMKLVNYQKQNEKEEKELLKKVEEEQQEKIKVNTEVEEIDHFGALNKELDESLKHVKKNEEGPINKSQFENILSQEENKIIDSLFAQIASDESDKSKTESDMNIVSSDPSKSPKESNPHVHWEEEDSLKKATGSADSDDMNEIVGVTDGSASHQHIHGEVSGKNFPGKDKSSPSLSLVKPEIPMNLEAEAVSGSFQGIDAPEDDEPQSRKKDPDYIPEVAANNVPNPEVEDQQSKNKNFEEDETEFEIESKDEGVKAPNIDEKGRVKLTDKKELQKREQEKNKERKKKEAEKTKNALEESCREALKNVLFSKSMEQPREFGAEQVSVFTIDSENFKGFVMLAESFNQGFDKSSLESLRNNIIDLMKSKGHIIEIGSSHTIKIPKANYLAVIDAACDFTVFEEEETGKQIILSFLEREVIHPQYEDSDKEGMIMVDMKTIPPQTPVNFDAFIYLPRNKRFVRYLKDGRSLSLKQVKRHIEEKVPCKLYLPKNDKGKLIQFFLQNTISWEFISHGGEDKESA